MKEKLKQIYRMTNPYFSHLRKPIAKGTIMYESFFGQSISCGPYALFRELVDNKDMYGSFHHVWSVADINTGRRILDKLGIEADVELVKYKSSSYNKYLATSEYVINNVTFPQYFRKREGQIYINTWHGIPLKKMGYEAENGIVDVANTVRNMLQADYLLSPNKHHTNMYNESYKLKEIYNGVIIEEGQARCDRLFKADRNDVLSRMKQEGINIAEEKKIILYAPTWRGTVWDNPAGSIEDYNKLYDYLSSNIDSSRYQLLIKPHVAVYRKWAAEGLNIDYIVPPTIDTNEILSVVDVLISDYSSIFYDFIVTDRPVLFYCNDIDEYNKYRGLDDIEDKLPGPFTASLEELCRWINSIEDVFLSYKDKYEQIKKWAAPYEDGNSCRRILDIVFSGDKEHSLGKQNAVNHAVATNKEKILFFLGSLRAYGITYSMLSLLNNMDYNKYDVTLYIYKPANDSDMQRLMSIPKEVRVIVHSVSAIGSIKDNMRFLKELTGGYRNNKEFLSFIGRSEYVRMFGQTRFDYVVDFVGYSPLFSIVAANAPGAVKSIWQHNDMKADHDKIVNGKRPNKKRLDAVFGTYPEFDNIVACSKSVMEVNKRQIGGNDNYRFVRNMIDVKRIRECLKDDEEGVAIDSGYINFVNIGRLSEEKNQLELIKAFEEFSKSHNYVRLYIIGDGILRELLEVYINDHKLSDKVILTGNVANPFSIMNKCQCFVLPSCHEGQPMVILEARTLGLPIIMSNFSTAADCLIDNGQIICDTDKESIIRALDTFVNNGIESYCFDAEEYNKMALLEFENAIR